MTREHQQEQLNPGELARACAYDHAHRLIDALAEHGHHAQITVGDSSFAGLERIE